MAAAKFRRPSRVRLFPVASQNRLDLDLTDMVARQGEFCRLLALEIAAFIIGAGQVRVQDSPKGMVVFRLDQRLE